MSYTAEEKIKLAGEDSKDRLYETKQNQKAIRILTVAAYVLCVSLVAIMLSLYYIFFWDPSTNTMQQKTQTIDTLIIPEHLAIRLANRSEVPANRFFHSFYQHLVQDRMVKIRKEVQINESGNLTQLIELYHQQQQEQRQQQELEQEQRQQQQKQRRDGQPPAEPPGGVYRRPFTQQQQQKQSQQLAPDGQPETQRQDPAEPGSPAVGRNPDEEDASDDYEQSGNYQLLYSNNTTIQLDADEQQE